MDNQIVAEPAAATPNAARDVARIVCVILAVAVAAALALAFWWSSSRGFDFTDEGFHLNTLRHASHAPQGGSQFASVVRMLTFGRTLSVAGYRLFGYALLELAAVVAAFAVVRFARLRLPGLAGNLPPTVAVVATAMVGATLGYSWLPRTVSYLVLTPVLLCVIGALGLLLAAGPERSWRLRPSDIVVAVVWGAAGSLLFYTKFSSAAAGMAITLLAVVVAVGWRRGVAIAVVVGAIFLVVTVGLNASSGFSVSQLFKSASALGGGSHSPSALQNAYLDELRHLTEPAVEGALALALLLFAPLFAVRLRRPQGLMIGAGCAVVGAAGFVHTLGGKRPPWELSPIVVFAVLGALALALLEPVVERRLRPQEAGDASTDGVPEPRPRDTRAWIALALVVLGLPFAGSVGTNTGLLSMALGTGALLALTAVVLIAQWRSTLPEGLQRNAVVAVPLAIVLACFGFVVARSVTRDLYRVPFPAKQETLSVPGVAPLDGLRVDRASRDLIERTVAAAKSGPGVPGGSPILTTSNLEGLAYVLDGYVPGSGWIDASPTTCARLEDARANLAATNLLIVGLPLGKRVDACFRRTVPGYPAAFHVVATIDLDRAWQIELGEKQVVVMRRQ